MAPRAVKPWPPCPARQAGGMPTASAPGRVTLIGDHTDYNGGVSLAHGHRPGHRGHVHAEARAASWSGLDSDQFRRDRSRSRSRPGLRVRRGGAARAPAWRRHSSAWRPPATGGTGHGDAARCPWVPGSPRAPPSRWRSCSRSATTPTRAPGADRARRPSAHGRVARRAARPARHRRRRGRSRSAHRLLHARDATRSRSPRTRPSSSCTAKHRGCSSGTRRTPPGAPSASVPRSCSGSPSACATLGDLSALPDPVLRRRAPPRGDRVRPGAPGRARCSTAATWPPRASVMTEGHRSLADDYRVSVAGGRRAGRGAPGPARACSGPGMTGGGFGGCVVALCEPDSPGPLDPEAPRSPRRAWRVSPARPALRCVAWRRSRRARRARPGPGRCRSTRRPGSSPASRSSAAPGHHERRGRVEQADVAAGARLSLEHGADHPGVEGGVAASQVVQGGRSPGRASTGRPASSVTS